MQTARLFAALLLVAFVATACVLVVTPDGDGGYRAQFEAGTRASVTPSRTPSSTPVPAASATPTRTPAPGPVVTRDNAPLADPAFDRTQLAPETRDWLDKLYAALDNPKPYPPVGDYLAIADTYWSGRSADQTITAISMALRATGDPELVKRIYDLSELARKGLHERGGFKVFLDQTIYCPPYSTPEVQAELCNKDVATVNETLVFGSVAHWAYVLWTNRALDARYDTAAQFWIGWLESHLAKWQQRKPYQPDFQWLDKGLYHCYSAMMRGYYYLGVMTGNARYTAEAERRAEVLIGMMRYVGGRWIVDHRVTGMGDPLYAHPVPYALHTWGMWVDLALDGFAPLTDEIMSRWADTLAQVVAGGEMGYYLNGGGEKTDWVKYSISTAVGLALWDQTGRILSRTQWALTQVSQPERQAMIPGAMVYVSAQRQQSQPFALAPAYDIGETQQPYIILYPDGSWQYAQQTPALTATLTPTATSTPTVTPSQTATYTPTVTNTPAPEPTQEPTFTPGPTFTPEPTKPTPEPTGCYGTVKVSSLLFRDAPVNGNVIGSWSLNERVLIFGVHYAVMGTNRIDEWAHIRGTDDREGWSAAYFNTATYIAFDNTQECLEVRYPEPDTALLWHAVPGANGGEMLASYGILRQAGIPYGVKTYADINYCIQALDAGGICIYRTPPDCPQMDIAPEWSAVLFMEDIERRAVWALRPYTGTGRLWIEPTNECHWVLENYEWWRDWATAALDYAEANNWPPLAWPGLGPGYGDLDMFRIWEVPLRRLADMGGLFAMHAYTVNDTPGLCESNIWLGYRHRLNHGYMAAFGYAVDVTITEAAREWGGSPVNEADFVCWYREASKDKYLHSVALWLTGYHHAWPLANLEGHMIGIARKLMN